MKKILFVSSCYPSKELPQYCIFLEQQAKSLIDEGNLVDVLIPTDNIIINKIYSETLNGINLHYISYKDFKLSNLLNYMDSVFVKNVEDLIISNKYDCISIHLCTDSIVKSLIKISKRNNIKVIVHYHGLNVWKDYYSKHPYYSKYIAYKRKNFLKNADAIIGVSNKVCNIIKEKLPNANIFTVYNGVDCRIFKPLDNKSKGGFNIICVANLIPIKGQTYLISALEKLIRCNPDNKINLKIVGRGIDETVLKEKVISLGISQNVEFLGYVKYEEISKLISESDVFVMPSYYEALGCVYLEAMACNVPVIGCKGMGIEEIIQDGKNGLLVEPQSIDDIYYKLEYLLKNESERLKIAENGYKTVVSEFTWTDSGKRLNEIYEMIL